MMCFFLSSPVGLEGNLSLEGKEGESGNLLRGEARKIAEAMRQISPARKWFGAWLEQGLNKAGGSQATAREPPSLCSWF